MHDSLRTFEHHRLDAHAIALEALKGAEEIAKALPRGYGTTADQVRRASQSAFLQLGEGVARSGGERAMRLRGARAEASEAAAAIEGLLDSDSDSESESESASVSDSAPGQSAPRATRYAGQSAR